MNKIKIKSFLFGFDYAVKNYSKIEDHHYHVLPNVSWHDKYTNQIYRKGIAYGRKYMQYRSEILTLSLVLSTMLIFMFTW